MPLFQRRQQQLEKAERIASGESIPEGNFDTASRTRLFYAIRDCAPADVGGFGGQSVPLFAQMIRDVLLTEWGRLTLGTKGPPADDLASFVINGASDKEMLDVIEATFEAFRRVDSQRADFARHGHKELDQFRSAVNRILDEHDVGYQAVGNEVVPRGSMVMYGGVVEPALSLLHGRRELANVERAFGDGLRELKPGGSPGDAITDAARALQEMLVAVGAEGNSLGLLLTSAKKKGLLGPYDSKLAQGVELIGEWVSADRSERGDAHLERDPTVDDAWLAVHVVGALIVRLEKRL
jgi:hypothetical protein